MYFEIMYSLHFKVQLLKVSHKARVVQLNMT